MTKILERRHKQAMRTSGGAHAHANHRNRGRDRRPRGRVRIELVASSWWGPNHHFVHYFVGAGARYLNWVAITPGEWRIESWTARGEVADALKEFEGWWADKDILRAHL
jgi:hypothetical protein